MTLDPREEALRALMAQSERPRPDAAFAARLRAQFVSGSIPARRRGVLEFPPQLWLIPLAAAAMLLIWFGRPQQEALPWQLRHHQGLEYVLLDGQRIPLDQLEAKLQPGRLLALPPRSLGRLELQSGGMLYLQLDHSVRLRLPELDGERMIGEVSGSGQLRVVTGPTFPGNELHLSSARAQWRVTGTAFTAIVHGESLCLCVMHGVVEACERGAPMEAVPAGMRFTIAEHADEPDRGEMIPAERVALEELVLRAQNSW